MAKGKKSISQLPIATAIRPAITNLVPLLSDLLSGLNGLILFTRPVAVDIKLHSNLSYNGRVPGFERGSTQKITCSQSYKTFRSFLLLQHHKLGLLAPISIFSLDLD
jgi:hypothetical protein